MNHIHKTHKTRVFSLQNFEPDQIFNADETGLAGWLGSDRTITEKADKVSGSKKDKPRITLMLCVNLTGNKKIKPFVIGKFKTPRCLKNVNMNSSPVK